MRSVLPLVSLLALAGCSLSESDPAEVSFVVSLPRTAPTSLAFEAALAGQSVALSPLPDTGGRTQSTDPIETAARRTSVACTVSDGTAATRGAVLLDLEPGWRYAVQCAVGEANPADACFGCRGAEAFALDPALDLSATDSLFVVWGGDPIDEPVLY